MIKIKNIYFLFFVLITILSVNSWTSFRVGNTFFWWGIQILFFITILSTRKNYFNKLHKKTILPVIFFLTWMLVCIVRGFFVAENYWEFKNIVNFSFNLLLGLVVPVFMNPVLNQFILKKWFKFVLPLFFVFILFIGENALGHYLAPIVVLSLVFPLLSKKWKIIVLFLTIYVVLMGQSARGNIIKFTVAFSMGYLFFYFRGFLSNKLLNFVRLFLLIAPIILFVLGVLGVFNVFNMSDYIEGDYTTNIVKNGEMVEQKLTIDTRTFLYEEVIASSIKNDYIFLGRTPARGTDTAAFIHLYQDVIDETGKEERYSQEVSILNVFTWTGLVGVVLYFLVFFRASYLAIHKSNNLFIKIIGLFVAFRWMYAWVEDFSRFDMNNIILWMLISMCFSESFRSMNNTEMKLWVCGIFDKRDVLKAGNLKIRNDSRKTT